MKLDCICISDDLITRMQEVKKNGEGLTERSISTRASDRSQLLELVSMEVLSSKMKWLQLWVLLWDQST